MQKSSWVLMYLEKKIKIEVPEGTTMIGRGPFLNVTDKRVSRSHAVLEVTDDELRIKPVHTNPTFYKTKDSLKLLPLEKGEWKKLCDGDHVSLLPKDLVFCINVTKCSTPNEKKKEKKPSIQNKSVIEENEINNHHKVSSIINERELPINNEDEIGERKPPKSPKFQSVKYDTESNDMISKMVMTREPMDSLSKNDVKEQQKTYIIEDVNTSSTPKTTKLTETVQLSKVNNIHPNVKEKKRILPSWMASVESSSSPPVKKKQITTSKTKKKEKESDFIDDKEADVDIPPAPSTKTAISKRRPTPVKPEKPQHKTLVKPASPVTDVDDDGVVQMTQKSNEKKEQSVKIKDINEKISSDDENSVSVKDVLRNDEKKDVKEKNGEEDKKLPKCPYGKSCYRKNPSHFQEYTHGSYDEADSDDGRKDGDDDRSECPYGTSCYRQNPQHKKEYKHTQPPALSSSPPRKRSKRTRKATKQSVVDGDSDDDGEGNAYDYDDSFLDDADISDTDSSSYANDASDSDYDPGEDNNKDLMSEAKDFITNTEM